MSDSAQELMVPETSTQLRELANVMGFDPDMDFRKLISEAKYHIHGFRLVDKSDLIGVPHVIVGVTYRPGFPIPGSSVQGDYVSVEAVVADKDTLMSAPIRHMLPNELTVFGNEPIIYNDGSTGIRRSLTEIFQTMGMIDVGTAKKDDNRFDKPHQMWAAGEDRAVTGIVADLDGEKFRLPVARGLRVSEYEWNGQPARTFYLG